MESVTISLLFLLSVVLSGVVARALPFAVPQPLVQIGFGALLASITGSGVTLHPDVFFLLFLPPLLFLDAWRLPKAELRRDAAVVLELAFGLVFFTVLGLGLMIHWMLPAMPLAVAFALAAILSPTDPIAVSSIAQRVPIPRRLMHILEGESLLNDASGLVCMRFAVAAALTGSFSIGTAIVTFLWLAIAGVATGILVTMSVTAASRRISKRYGEESGSQVLVSLLLPFGAYLVAEQIGASGILAAVAAGFTMSHAEQSGNALALTRVRRGVVWDIVQMAANGIIFVLLGQQLPRIITEAERVVRETGHQDPIWLLVYVAAINTALAALRFAWVWVSLRLALRRLKKNGRQVERPSWRLVAATSLAGARGAITLAGVLTLPLVMADGTAFPARDLAIFLAAGVIIVSLIAASIGLPMLLKGLTLPPTLPQQEIEDRARATGAKAAIRAVEAAQHRLSAGAADAEIFAAAAARVMDLYRAQIDGHEKTGEEAARSRQSSQALSELRLAGLRAERDEYYRLGRARRLSDETVRKLVREIDMQETRFN